jgi:hypothetical protein
MQEREAQESPAEVCRRPDEDPFRLWAATLSRALEGTSSPDNSDGSDFQVAASNGASSNGKTTAASLKERQPDDEEAEHESLAAARRRVRLEKERLRLEQDAMRQAVEEVSRLRTEVQARRIKAAGDPQRGQGAHDETGFWPQAKNETPRQAKEEIQGTRAAADRAAVPVSEPAEETTQQIQLWSPQSTRQPATPDNAKAIPSGKRLKMLIPNLEHSEDSVSGAKLAFATCKRRIIRYSRKLWGRLS